MIVFIIRRLAQSLLVLFVTSIIVFAGIYAIGNPIEILIAGDATPGRAGTGDPLARPRPIAPRAIRHFPLECPARATSAAPSSSTSPRSI